VSDTRPRRPSANDRGFTLVELLVVMIVIGVLASIAIPTLLTQQAKGHDTSTQADVSNLGKEVATYFVDGTGTLTLDFTSAPGRVLLGDGAWSTSVQLTNGTAAPTTGVSSNMGNATGWCVALTDPKGSQREYRYSAMSGSGVGSC